ncbi:MAG TPA: CxxH/CxxC protein [Clostridiaceae bacterium]
MENIYCCENHINIGIDEYITDHETFPIMIGVLEDKCDYCNLPAIYQLSNKSVDDK